MTLSDLQNRLSTLKSQQQQLQQQLTTIAANISAYSGAIQECEYWIGVVNTVPEYVATPDGVAEGDNVSFQ